MTATATAAPRTDELLQAALDYAARGWHVFPVHSVRDGQCSCGDPACRNPGKHPRTQHGKDDATVDDKTIRAWWARWPDANIGIATEPSGLLVVDVDPAHGGEDALEMLEREHGALPATVEAITGGGGRHLYFRRPEGDFRNTTSKIGKGLDTRGIGGYVVAPPSLHRSGNRYEWELSSGPDDVPLADPPAWLVELLQKPAPVKVADASTADGKIPEGQRNDRLTSLAGTLQRKGLTAPAILAALKEENAARCTPPLDDHELQSIVSSVGRYEPATPYTSTTDPDDPNAQPAEFQPTFLTAGEMLTCFPQQREPVVEGALRRGEVMNVVSGPKMYKTWTMLNLAMCVVTGRPWLGFPTRPGRVLVLDFELAGGTIAKRLYNVATAMGITATDLGDKLAIQPLRGKQLSIVGLGSYLDALPAGRFDLVIIDPLYRLFPKDMDENSNANLAALFATLASYAEGMNAGLITVHHLSKGDQSGKSITDLGAGGGSQARAADAHLALRPHAEEGAAVLAGVLRSWPPFEPVCLRWAFPMWTPAPDLDPLDLWRAPRRSAKPKAEEPSEPPPPPWTVERFASECLRADPQTKAAIIEAAVTAGVPNVHQAERLLSRAEDKKLAFAFRPANDRRRLYYTSQSPLTLETPE